MLDRYHIGRHTRQSPEADVPLIEQLSIDDRLGGAGNVACNLKSLELNPILLSVIGDDAEGRVIEDLCTEKFETYHLITCLLYTSPSPRDKRQSRMPSSA